MCHSCGLIAKSKELKVSSKELHREHFDRAVFLPLSRWNESSVGGQACTELSEQKIRRMGVRAQGKCIIKPDAEAKLPRRVCVRFVFSRASLQVWVERCQRGRGVTALPVTLRIRPKCNSNAISALLNQPPLQQWRRGGNQCLKLIFLSVIF